MKLEFSIWEVFCNNGIEEAIDTEADYCQEGDGPEYKAYEQQGYGIIIFVQGIFLG